MKGAQNNLELQSFLLDYDFVALQETWTSNVSDFNDYLEGFQCYNVPGHRRSNIGHWHGGINVFVKQNLAKHAKRVFSDSMIAVYILFPGSVFNIDRDLLIISAYIPPENSTFYEDIHIDIHLLECEIVSILEKIDEPYILLLGDLNARTGVMEDYNFNDSIKHLPIEDWYQVDNFNEPRKSCDINEKVNNFGRELLFLCKTLSIHILNGRFADDADGHFTCLTQRGASVIDYGILSSQLFYKVQNFKVIPYQFTNSVHLLSVFKICVKCNV